MVDTLGLYRLAESSRIPILPFPLPQTGSVSLDLPGRGCVVGLDEAVVSSERDKKVHLAHELATASQAAFIMYTQPSTTGDVTKTAPTNGRSQS